MYFPKGIKVNEEVSASVIEELFIKNKKDHKTKLSVDSKNYESLQEFLNAHYHTALREI